MTGRLAGAASAYLRSAADQPVDWYPWGAEAFAAARERACPILLDIGAVWCHWCHVMDHESYEDPAVGQLLNRDFVCIKVDRDERPEVDTRYQRAVQAITGQGGWPLTAFLTPDGEVFFGGTYFPPADLPGRPGFRTVLGHVSRFWREHRDRALQQARSLRDALAARADQATPGPVTPALLLAAERAMQAECDPAFGGFGRAPKFPHPGALRFLLGRWADGGSTRLRHAGEESLLAMVRGGIHDQLAGGFHRYSVDRQWIIPHFEKMTSDNAELLRVLAFAGALLDNPELVEAARQVVGWVRRDLAHPDGGYAASQDADVGPDDDGSHFTWTREEMATVLDVPRLDVAVRRFGMDTAGVMPHHPARNVLFIAATADAIARETNRTAAEAAQLIAEAVEQLAAARAARRPVPTIDPARYTVWSAMMAGALLGAAPVLRDDWAREHGLATLRWLRQLGAPGRLPRRPGGEGGLLDDQVHAAGAALDAFEATGDTDWLEWAEAAMETVWHDFWDPVGGGCFDLARGHQGAGLLDTPMKPIQDTPSPSANGVAGLVLARLAAHTGEPRWRDRQQAQVEAFAGRGAALGVFGATWLLAADWWLNPVCHLVVTGAADDPTAAELHRLALAAPLPRRVVRRLHPGDGAVRLLPELRAMLEQGTAASGYLCIGNRCLAPARGPGQWAELIREAQGRVPQ